MRLSAVLPETAIAVGLDGTGGGGGGALPGGTTAVGPIGGPTLDKWGVIEKLTDLLVTSKQAQPQWRDLILRSLTERERQSSTGMQDGFAIPHSRMDEPIQSTLVSLAVLAHGMDFDAIDGQPTRTVVCLVTPRKQSREHLRVLAGIAQLFARHEFRAALLDARTPAEVLQVIRAEEEQIPA
ncbi:MAG: PTS sugar transporter subunit IIA [Planctomycetes bacterium]|nr:PTS sugar transporter subunit IIA [Planctomycetota bacterium]